MNSFVIRAEDKDIWEKRAPVVPDDLRDIVLKAGITAFVQKSDIRFFKDDQYQAAGARLCDDIKCGDIIVGIKEIPEDKLLDNKIYLFFSHTIKGQKANMPMLQKIIAGGSTLIDYEKIIDNQNRRLIFFGNYAGDAGALEILYLTGRHWEYKGISTPFSRCQRPVVYDSVKSAHQDLAQIGEQIKSQGLPAEIAPMVIGILGYGNVSTGAQHLLDCLPIERIPPQKLPVFIENQQGTRHRVYLTIFKEEHLVEHKSKQSFQLQDYYAHPENYKNRFYRYLPYLTILINGLFWSGRYPHFVTWNDLKQLFQENPNPKLCGIADISADLEGAIECTVKHTNIGNPAYLCDPVTRTITEGYLGKGIVIMAVDNLPAEFPNDASTFFSNQLKRFLENILKADFRKPLRESGLCKEVQKAVIVYQGELTPDYGYLEKYL